jgi:hypothetical protein
MEEKERKTLVTRLGYKIEDTEKNTGRHGDFKYPSNMDPHHALAMYLRMRDLRTHVYPDVTCQGLHIIRVGETSWSRLLGVHLQDMPGIIYLLGETENDDGKLRTEVDVIVQKVLWISSFTKVTFSGLKQLLGAIHHPNTHLAKFA